MMGSEAAAFAPRSEVLIVPTMKGRELPEKYHTRAYLRASREREGIREPI